MRDSRPSSTSPCTAGGKISSASVGDRVDREIWMCLVESVAQERAWVARSRVCPISRNGYWPQARSRLANLTWGGGAGLETQSWVLQCAVLVLYVR